MTELGPWINVTSGIAAYPWPRFIIWDALGEVLWVVLYVMLGYIFSDRVQYIAEILGNLAWAIPGSHRDRDTGLEVIQIHAARSSGGQLDYRL